MIRSYFTAVLCALHDCDVVDPDSVLSYQNASAAGAQRDGPGFQLYLRLSSSIRLQEAI